jgi:hypothetical protein
VLVVEAPPAGDDLFGIAACRGSDLARGRDATKFHHLGVGQVAKLEIDRVHRDPPLGGPILQTLAAASEGSGALSVRCH